MTHCKPSTQITRMFIEDAVRTVLRECVERETQDRPSMTVRLRTCSACLRLALCRVGLAPGCTILLASSVRLHARLVA